MYEMKSLMQMLYVNNQKMRWGTIILDQQLLLLFQSNDVLRIPHYILQTIYVCNVR